MPRPPPRREAKINHAPRRHPPAPLIRPLVRDPRHPAIRRSHHPSRRRTHPHPSGSTSGRNKATNRHLRRHPAPRQQSRRRPGKIPRPTLARNRSSGRPPQHRRRTPARRRLPPSQAHPRHLLRTAEPQRLPLRLPDPTHPRFSSRRIARPRRPRSGKETSHRARRRNRDQFQAGRHPT